MVTGRINYPSHLLTLKNQNKNKTETMQVKILIPEELQKVLKSIKRKDKRNSLLEIYNALTYKDVKYNKDDRNEIFPVPSAYLVKIRKHYNKYINILLDNNIIGYQSFNKGFKTINLFEDKLYNKKYYNTHTGECMRYCFNIDIENGIEQTIEVPDSLYSDENWYQITIESLQEIKLPIRIIRDSFSRRLHTTITSNTGVEGFDSYKTYLSAFGGYSSIDVKECQPTLLYLYFKDRVEIDDNYVIGKIYSQINSDRDKAKKEFVTWLNAEIHNMPRHINKLFPELFNYIVNYKSRNGYKSLGAKLQRIESNIVIDDLLDNINREIGVEFCLTVHDSLIVRNEDVDKVYEWVTNKYKELEFKKEEI